jgi:hypothetical protein
MSDVSRQHFAQTSQLVLGNFHPISFQFLPLSVKAQWLDLQFHPAKGPNTSKFKLIEQNIAKKKTIITPRKMDIYVCIYIMYIYIIYIYIYIIYSLILNLANLVDPLVVRQWMAVAAAITIGNPSHTFLSSSPQRRSQRSQHRDVVRPAAMPSRSCENPLFLWHDWC